MDRIEIKAVLGKLLAYAWDRTCIHEDTYEGGTDWEICSECGQKWPRGEKPDWETTPDAEDICVAEDMLSRLNNGEVINQAGVYTVLFGTMMKYDPARGFKKPYPCYVAPYREWHGAVAWLFDPWTGKKREPEDIGSDTFGYLIVPPKEQNCE